MYKKILIPVDGEGGCKRALKAVAKALPLCDGEFVLLHVEPPISLLLSGAKRREVVEQMQKECEAIVKPVAEYLDAQKKPYSIQMGNGKIATTISRVVVEQSIDAIVMVSDGINSVNDLVLGSISQRVLECTDVDALIIRG